MKKKSVLFVCTGNVFRSMSAEYCLKQLLSDRGIKGWRVSSAGIEAMPEPVHPKTLEVLEKLGIQKIEHKQKKLTKKMLEDNDVVVAIAKDHLDFIQLKLRHPRVLLFNELALRQRTSIWDIEDTVKDYKTNRKAVEKQIERTVKEIHRKTPQLFQNISERFYLFSDFMNGLISHRNGYPFITLYETKNTIAFMSIDIPSKESGHVLIIPKKRYADFSEIPAKTRNELLEAIQKIGKAVGVYHGGYNILLNNGADAGQYIFHVHFHVILRKRNDGVIIESWNRRNISKKDFIKLNDRLKKEIQRSVVE
jgi:protein-tyrosine phosphatase